MAYQAAGTPVSTHIFFNSGYLDFGSNRMVELSGINLETTVGVEKLFVLNSIKAQDIARKELVVKVSAKVKSFSPEVEALFYGLAASGTPMGTTVLDGQPTLQNPVVNVYDKNNKQYQWQLLNAIITSSKQNFQAETYAEIDLEVEATDIVLLYTA